MSWANKRRSYYILGLLGILALLMGVILYFLLDKEPTCFDNKQNQEEIGVDCGGPCDMLCESQVAGLNILWARSFKIAPGVYNSVAYIENPNLKAGIKELKYTFKIFDKEGVLIKERFGKTYVLPGRIVSIFEPSIRVGNRIPKRTDIKIREGDWVKVSENEKPFEIENIVKELDRANPRISASLVNNSVDKIEDIEVTTVIFDLNGNALNTSQTYVESIKGEESKNIYFTWQEPIKETVSSVDIKPYFNFLK